jgi:nucleoside-diphosphate-sugar epimerase
MRVALTGATGFLGRSLVAELAGRGDAIRAAYRPGSDRGGFEPFAGALQWAEFRLDRAREEADALVTGCDAVVHAALDRPGAGFMGAEGDLRDFVAANVLGTIDLIEAARRAGVPRFVFVSTCAVHDVILDDRPLDEAHPTWARSHYGAHKAAIEAFVSSFGRGQGYAICALRPTGIYGLARPASESKWFDLVARVVAGEPVTCRRGGKEVHAADVARAASILLNAPADAIAGRAFNCYDRYVSEYDVATIAQTLAASRSTVRGEPTHPKHEIETGALRALGMTFGGDRLLERSIGELVAATSTS